MGEQSAGHPGAELVQLGTAQDSLVDAQRWSLWLSFGRFRQGSGEIAHVSSLSCMQVWSLRDDPGNRDLPDAMSSATRFSVLVDNDRVGIESLGRNPWLTLP
ncbi:hypothetical protein AB0I69_03685 [Streptomyces sp. NPDC050508]|uniref:hypothetical protein n=1 Tax=Streptomyces sp. NPDC050508 TaxID=3155405 RepID=UPI0034320759